MHYEKTALIIALSALLIAVITLLILIWKTGFEPKLIEHNSSPKGEYSFSLFSVGEPTWPFGRAAGYIHLQKVGEEIYKENISLATDGSDIRKENWCVIWGKNYVDIKLTVPQQENEIGRAHV